MAIARKPPARPFTAAASAPEIAAAPAEAFKADSEAVATEPTRAVQEGADAVLAQVRDTQERIRKATEEGMERTRGAYARLKSDAEAATGSLATSLSATRSGLQSLNETAFDAIKAQTQAGFDHARALLSIKDPQEFFALQSEFARKQFEAITTQTQEFTSHLQKIATESVAPLKAAMGQRFSA